LGLAGVIFTLVVYFLDLTFNKSISYVFFVISALLLYYFIVSYRNNYLHGFITYGQSVGAGVVIYLYYSIITAIFIYILYTVIDPSLTDKMLAFMEEEMAKRGLPEASLEQMLAMQKKFMKPEIMAPGSIVNNMIIGTVISLIISIFTRKEGNPLVDSSSI
jgi:hypothetical protein